MKKEYLSASSKELVKGDITYTDEALYENKLSVVFDSSAKVREKHICGYIYGPAIGDETRGYLQEPYLKL